MLPRRPSSQVQRSLLAALLAALALVGSGMPSKVCPSSASAQSRLPTPHHASSVENPSLSAGTGYDRSSFSVSPRRAKCPGPALSAALLCSRSWHESVTPQQCRSASRWADGSPDSSSREPSPGSTCLGGPPPSAAVGLSVLRI